MSGITIVTGATGRLGQRVVRRLLERKERVRVLTRRPQDAARLWGDRVELAAGDFAEPSRLPAVFSGAERLFLLSPIGERLAAYQNGAIDAAVAAGIGRIVKISGSDWTIENADRSVSGAAHAEVEAHLKRSGVPHVAIRPNAWMQVSLAPVVAAAARGEHLPVRYGGAAVSYIDAEDIAEVAVHALLAEKLIDGPLVLTGGEALTAVDIARIAAGVLKRPLALSETAHAGVPPHLAAFERRAIAEFIELMVEGLAASVTDTVKRLTGRPPRSAERFLANQFASASPLKVSTGEKTWH
ncbi:NAD(P)H-binding protein [Rhizobiaceae bacterium BDR2-2]|uniref:NAD(P)H-binding protein n=1 Tax=Ectorhizobium quercum TaxID=2965071 RepID=A0AAE3N3R1_9HYPH|nr:NmrA family NAD(P)-binding protein [Ectorhizobium quercum]MCX8999671.1 NAD(P)H-binding protein [Ectorhizobium quercum]